MTKVVTFWSVDGGVGKSTLSTNLALNTALNNPTQRVLLLDFNLFNPDINYHLAIDPSKISLPLDAFSIKEISNENIATHIIRPTKLNNFWFLPGLADLNNFEKLDISVFDKIVEYLKSSNKYDYIFIDIDSALNIDATFSSINKSDLLCVVGEPTYLSIKNIMKVMDSVIKKILTHNNVIYIFNKMSKELVQRPDMEYVFGAEKLFVVDYNKMFPMCLNKQEILVYKNSKDLRNIKKQLDLITQFIVNGGKD